MLRSERRSQQTPVLAAVGPMQFEVVSHRMEHDFRAPMRLESLPYTFARRTRRQDISLIERRAGVEVVARQDGTHLALFSDQWQVKWVLRDHPESSSNPLPTNRPTRLPVRVVTDFVRS